MDLQHIAVKLFVKDAAPFDMAAMIPIFHGWIQQRRLEELMMIDVADYSHVRNGPGVMLICHEGQLAMDEGDGRLGLAYANKRLAAGSVSDRLLTALRRALSAAQLLEAEVQMAGKVEFIGNELLIRIDDRLHAPNTAETFQLLEADLSQALAGVYNGQSVELRQIENAKAAFAVMATTSVPIDVSTLLARLEGRSCQRSEVRRQ